jgi:hypothetical protein
MTPEEVASGSAEAAMRFRWFVSLYRVPVQAETRSEQAAEKRSHEMTRYLISFPSGAMDHVPDDEMPAVGEAAHAVIQEALDAGVLVFGGGLAENVDPVMVAGDGTITAGTYPQTKEFNGGFTVLDVPSREAALEWAAKIAAACRCAQEIREFGPDSAVGN